jgi:hypothetical protein
MLGIARKLAQEFPFVRVDLYGVKGKIYFSELTFYPGNAKMNFNPVEFDLYFGEQLDLKKIAVTR